MINIVRFIIAINWLKNGSLRCLCQYEKKCLKKYLKIYVTTLWEKSQNFEQNCSIKSYDEFKVAKNVNGKWAISYFFSIWKIYE